MPARHRLDRYDEPKKTWSRHRVEQRYVVEDRGYETPCWIWQVAVTDKGYGREWDNGRMRPAHCITYEAKYGPVPDGLELDHLCRNRACANPDHVEPVTHLENVHRGARPRLTPQQVQEIKASKERPADIAARYGIGWRHVYRIRSGERWPDAP